MNNIYLRSNSSIRKVLLYYYLALFPLIIYGFYKNGIKLYSLDLVNVYGLFKPLIITLVGFLIGSIIAIIFNKSKTSVLNAITKSFYPLYGVLVASTININTNILLFSVVLFVIFFLNNVLKIKVNIVAVCALTIILIMHFTTGFTFSNIYEGSHNFSLIAMDYLLGRGSGGINTTCAGLLLISLLILSNKLFYKKLIPIYSSLVFASLIIIYSVCTNNIAHIFDYLFANGILFSFVFIATDSLSSPYTKKNQIIYSIIIGIVTFCLFLIEPSLAALGAIVIASIMQNILDK